MKIEKVKTSGEYFKNIPIGECFKSSSQLYIKIPKVYDTMVSELFSLGVPSSEFIDYMYNAINITTNDLGFFNEEEIVYPKQAVLKIYEDK